MNDFLIFGATGLTGSYVLSDIKKRNLDYHLFSRQNLDQELNERQTLFDSQNIPELPESKNLIICLGYPLNFIELIYMSKEKKKLFKNVDLDLVIEIAKKAEKKGIPNIVIISAVGSDKNSSNYYLRIKGMMEKEILKLNFKKIIFAKPGHLLGPREASRVDNWVRVVELFGSIFSFLFVGPLRKFKNVQANYIAEEMINQIVDHNSDSDYLFEVHG